MTSSNDRSTHRQDANDRIEFTTLSDLLARRASEHPDKLLYSFAREAAAPRQVTYGGFHAAALRAAREIASRTQAGDRVLILHTPGLDYITAFFGCMSAGVIPVPCYPPTNRRNVGRVEGILKDSSPALILTSPGTTERLRRIVAFDAWLEVHADVPADADGQTIGRQSPDDVAFLQYTSGSTSEPKGVVVTHRSLLTNLEQSRRALRLTPDSVGVNWLPPYHDMGLIGGFLQLIYSGAAAHVLPPAAFLQQPIRWLRAISNARATHTGAPNFAYELCVRRITETQKNDLDLSSCEVAFCGAEPIRAQTLQSFYDAFKSCGFRREAFVPCYGLAEATLLVSAAEQRTNSVSTGDDDSDPIGVSCGRPVQQTVVIVDPATGERLPDGVVGEIWVAGDNVAAGYWNNPQASAATFGAKIANDADSPRFLRTGDLGSLHRGELYVAGRIKDLIILGGRNLYPQDVEAASCAADPSLRPNSAAAFSVAGGASDRMVLLQELDFRQTATADLLGRVRSAVFDATGVQPDVICLLKPGGIPRTSSGKVRRNQARQAFEAGNLPVLVSDERKDPAVHDLAPPFDVSDGESSPSASSAEMVETWIKEKIADRLGVDPQTIDGHQAFSYYGVDSLLAAELTDALSGWLQRPVSATLPWDYPSPARLARYLALSNARTDAAEDDSPENRGTVETSSAGLPPSAASQPIAIVGLGCRFPSAEDPEAFWNLLISETDAVRAVPAKRRAARTFECTSAAPSPTRVGGFLDEVDTFDPHFFGISPHEADRIDPQQRLLLEVAWEALENAAIAPGDLAGSDTGVFVGLSSHDYEQVQSGCEALDLYVATGSAASIAPNRLSYLLDLRGPSIAVDTACSSSLTAVHLACQALRTGEVGLALAGGVNLMLSDRPGMPFSAAGLLSETGRCKAFDAAADGYVRGEGCGMIVLKRLDDALRDADPVHALIAATAVRQDGRSNGLAAPNGAAQAEVIRGALARANVPPARLSYVEAHGTGTALGDPIELNALKEALMPGRRADETCLIGSVKSNIGHLEAAAGIAGLIKTVLALEKRTIPASLHYVAPNPRCSLDDTPPLAIASTRRPWPEQSFPRHAGVSSFGFGGTIAHAVLTEAPPSSERNRTDSAPCHLLCLSAKSAAALEAAGRGLARRLAAQDGPSLQDAAYTLQAGRNAFAHRRAFVVASQDEALRMLAEVPAPRSCTATNRIVFMFPGQGAQYVGMAHSLYRHVATFRKQVDACLALLDADLAREMRLLLTPESTANARLCADRLERTDLAQPALFIVSYSLAQLWMQSGVRPQAMIGHSLGEYVAACLAGVFSLEAALSLVTLRGRLMQSAPPGAMVGVALDEARAARYVCDGISVAAANAPERSTLAGDISAIEALERVLVAQDIPFRRLRTSHAFHSSSMNAIADAFLDALRAVSLEAPRIPYISCVSGTWIRDEQAASPEYWVEQMRKPVRFSAGLSALAATPDSLLLEVGPGRTLSGFARNHPACSGATILQTLNPAGDTPLDSSQGELRAMLQSLGRVWEAGHPVRWDSINRGNSAKRVALPTTPFERQRHWRDRYNSESQPMQTDMNAAPAPARPIRSDDAPVADRRAAIQARLCGIIAGTLRLPAERISPSAPLLDLGADSLMLTQAVRSIEGAFGMTPTVRQVFENLTTVADIAAYLDNALPATWRADVHGPAPSAPPHPRASAACASAESAPATCTPAISPSELHDIISRQLAVMSEQLTVLRSAVRSTTASQPTARDGLAAEYAPTGVLRDTSVPPIETREPAPVPAPRAETADDGARQGPTAQTDAENRSEQPSARKPFQAHRSSASSLPVLRPRPDGAAAETPLSSAQQRLWFLHQLEPGSPQYNVAGVLRVHGELDVARLERAINALIRRHEILRTTFHDKGGNAVQIVHEQLPIAVRLTDLSPLPSIEREAQAGALARGEASAPFDFSAGPLLRLHLLRINQLEHICLLTFHHIVADGWSSNILLHELSVAYAELSTGEALSLPPLPLQYADYALWQRAHLQGDVLDERLAFWARYLANAPALLELPYDRPRPPRQTYHGSVLTQQLGAAVAQQVRLFSRRHTATPYMVLLAAFSLLLSRYSGKRDIVVGSPIANRHHADLASVIGMFANTLAMRNRIEPQDSFGDFLARVRTNVLDAYVHQDLPFEHLVDTLKPERSASYSPIFQVMLSLQNTPKQEMRSDGLTIRQEPNPAQIAKLDITVNLSETDEGLQAEWEYNTDLFDRATIHRMAHQFARMLEQVMQAPERKLEELSLLTEAERELMLVDWNPSASHYGCATLPRLFEAQAARTPERIAAVFAQGQLTYAELNERANTLAHQLIELGVGPDIPVGICLARTGDLLVALLAVLKAGGAYVPLDPAYPSERLAAILDDVQPLVMLCTSGQLARLPSTASAHIALDRLQPNPAYSPLAPAVRIDPSDLAYVIYTSGSTGRPKGVDITHASLANFLQSMRERPGMTQDDVLLAVTSISFDIAALELWLPLITGATVVLADCGASTDAAQLRRLIERHRVTVMQATPPTWQMLLSEGWPARTFTPLCGGETLPPALARQLLAHSPKVWNLYGPSETTVWSALRCITAEQSRVVIGNAIANTQLYVLDSAGQPAPIGVVGELHIGGEGLARGYRNRPSSTAERFTPNPFGPAGSRLYRTGDLARWLPDGTVECLGRLDHQIKLRGFRIELGEIEAVLTAQPRISEAVAVAIDTPSGRHLVAYAIPQSGTSVDPLDLRRSIEAALPEYMVPKQIVLLERLPLTANGKVDRKALTNPAAAVKIHAEHVAPAQERELSLAAIWSELLNVPAERIGLNDSFFALGGHSLLATQAVVRIRDGLGCPLTVRDLFDHPTLGALAAFLGRQASATEPTMPPPASARRETLPVSYVQERIWFVHQIDRQDTSYNMPYALRMRGTLSAPALRRAFDALIARHESLRTTFGSDAHGHPVQIVASSLAADLPIVEATEETVADHVARHARHVFELERGPLLKTTLLRVGPNDHVLLLNVHHIVADGWSITIMVRDMEQLYTAAVANSIAPLPRLPIQYADFASWQRQQDLSAHLAYWQEALGDYEPGLPLPYDRPPTGKPSGAGTIVHRYSPQLAADLARFSVERGVTLFMTLATGLLIVLQRYTQRSDLCVGTTVAGRDAQHFEQLIGFFVNILALRVDLSGDPNGTTLLERVKEAALRGFEHQALPFEHLLNTLPHARGERSNGLVPIVVRHQNFAAPSSSWAGGLTVEGLPCGDRTAKCELDFQFTGDGAQLEVLVEYAADLFDAATVERLLQHHQRAMQELLGAPDRRLSDFSILSADELAQLDRWNRFDRAFDTSTDISSLFQRNVAAYPERVACFDADTSLTYAALNERANRLAHALRARGVSPDTRVGVLLPRSTAFLTTLIAIWKAGGVYVPIDVRAPQAYQQLLIEDAALGIIVASRALAACSPGVDTLYVDDDVSGWPDTDLATPRCPDNLACMLYTSGSTGRPKGVLVPHRQLLNLLHSLWESLPFGEDEVVAQKTPASYAVSLKELLGALLAGVPQILIADPQVKDVKAFLDVLQRAKVTRLFIVPSHLQAMLDALDDSARLVALRCCITAGEPLPQALRSRLRKHLPWVEVWNNFGCTELNDVSYCSPATQEQPLAAAAQFVPIGVPIPNVKLYVLDDNLELLPLGVAGELCVSHAGMPHGYWQRPGLSAERFVPDRFSGTPGGRLYRTGDIVRRLPDGTLEYLGRKDFEVKVRGHRIDVRQVELALTDVPGIRQAAVSAQRHAAGAVQLVAYCVPFETQPTIDADAIRAHLAQQLPSYMVPSLYVALPALPTLANGKFDRKALPAPNEQVLTEQPYAAPTTETQRALVRIWAELLQVPPAHVGIHNNFFALGGHSLLATQVLSRVRNAFGVDLPIETLFENPTVSAIADHIDMLDWIATGDQAHDDDDMTTEFIV